MFAALFLPNVLAFLAGQAAAWFYLRSGRFRVGVAATSALWLLLDWWIVVKLVFGGGEDELLLPAALLQGVAALIVAALLFALWRRRWSAAARARTANFAAGLTQLMRGEHAAARGTFVRLLRTDPWDAAAWIALGDAHRYDGQSKRARRCYRRAAAVDVERAHADVLALQQQRLRAGAAAAAVRSRES